MQLANGKIPAPADQKSRIQEITLFEAESDCQIDYMQFVNNGSSIVELTLKIQFLENTILLIPANYKINSYDPPVILTQKIYLKEFEKIIAVASLHEKIDYFINGTAQPVEEHPEQIDINEIVDDTAGGGEGYGGPYGEGYGE